MSDDTENPNTTPEDGRKRYALALAADIADLFKDIVDRAKDLAQVGVQTKDWLQLVGMHLSPPSERIVSLIAPYAGPAIDALVTMDGGSIFEAVTGGRGPVGAADRLRERVAAVYAARGKSVFPGEDTTSTDLANARRYALAILASEDSSSELRNLADCMLALLDDELQFSESAAAARMRMTIGRLLDENAIGDPRLLGQDQTPAMKAYVILRGMASPIGGTLSTTPEGGLRFLMSGGPVRLGQQVPDKFVEQFFDYSDVVSVAIDREVSVGGAESKIITPS